jgi:single-strand DNA-binding protein
MHSLTWGAGATCPWVPRKRAGQKKEISIMYQNRVSLIGFVGNDARLKSTNSGTPVAAFTVATKSSWKSSNGSYDSRTEWHRCIAWGKLAEFAGKLEKGAHVLIEGELRYREYKVDRGSDADSVPVTRRLTEIHANRILKLDRVAKQEDPVSENELADITADEPVA